MNIFEKVNQVLSHEINRVNSIVFENIQVSDDLVNQVTDYVLKRKGKRIRPIVTLISAKLLNDHVSDEAIYLACAVELVHIATLLHDDVIDLAKIRNSKLSPNQIWDNKTSILAGDFLFSQAFKFMVKGNSMMALSLLANSSAVIAEGEISQLNLQNQKRIITKDEYFNVIEKKTAILFACASSCGAIAASANESTISNFDRFGLLLGKIFQISDDLLDYKGLTADIGKDIGSDFFEGKVTLPFIILLNRLDLMERKDIEKNFFYSNKTESDLQNIIALMDRHDVVQEVYNIMNQLKEEALQSLSSLPNNEYKGLFIELLDFCITRKI